MKDDLREYAERVYVATQDELSEARPYSNDDFEFICTGQIEQALQAMREETTEACVVGHHTLAARGVSTTKAIRQAGLSAVPELPTEEGE